MLNNPSQIFPEERSRFRKFSNFSEGGWESEKVDLFPQNCANNSQVVVQGTEFQHLFTEIQGITQLLSLHASDKEHR